MDLPYNRFNAEAVNIIQDVAESRFVAFDLEFSGISGPAQRQHSTGKPTLQQLYEESKYAATKYQVLQVGLAIVKEDLEDGKYIVKPYNFNISPLPTFRERQFNRDWSMNSGAIQFLLKHGFDFNLPLAYGIPYLSRTEEAEVRLKLSGENDRKLSDMLLKPEDDNLIKHIRTSIAAWQAQPQETKEVYLNIPNDDRKKGVPGTLNRYQMRLTHQVVQNEFPDLQTTGMREFVQITNPSQEERNRQKTLQKEHVDREIGRAVGFRWILEAIAGREISGMSDDCFLAAISQFPPAEEETTPFSGFVTGLNAKLAQRRKVLIGHNCFTDLVFLHQFYAGELPDRVEDFQKKIHELFPAVIDTKHIASYGTGRWGDTSLAAVEEELQTEPEPEIVIPPEFDRYDLNEKPHEAGYDALLTAKIAIKLSAKMEREAVFYNQEATQAATNQPQDTSKPFGTKEGDTIIPETQNSKSTGLSSTDYAVDSKQSGTTQITELQAKTTLSAQTESLVHDPILEADSSSPPSDLIAIKDKKPKPRSHSGRTNTATEVSRLRSNFAATNIYDILDQQQEDADQNPDPQQGAIDPSSLIDTNAQPELSRIDFLVKQGKIMPRWDGGNRFWQQFGNKLQVNSCKEGICVLGPKQENEKSTTA